MHCDIRYESICHGLLLAASLEFCVRVRVRVRGVRSHIHTTLRVIGFGLVWRRDDLP